jgi:GNAT superfamily N-acetyltransferase
MPSPRPEWIDLPPKTWPSGDYRVTTDRARVDLDVVHEFLTNDSYWANGRTREQTARANEMSTCFSVIHEPTGAMVGFARVLTDDVSFGWVADVFVLDGHRGRGVAVFLMGCVVEAYSHVSRLVLGTRDAHGVYAKVGFEPIIRVDRWMERWSGAPND